MRARFLTQAGEEGERVAKLEASHCHDTPIARGPRRAARDIWSPPRGRARNTMKFSRIVIITVLPAPGFRLHSKAPGLGRHARRSTRNPVSLALEKTSRDPVRSGFLPAHLPGCR